MSGGSLNVPILSRITRWECPNCDLTSVTVEQRPHSQMHRCRNGLSTPMVEAGTKCKVEHVERGDYVNGELVQTDLDGRPIMAAVVTRDDGEDRTVYAPAAQGRD